MRVTYLGVENEYHILEWLPTDKQFPALRVLYVNRTGLIEITPGYYNIGPDEADAFAFAINAAFHAITMMKQLEDKLAQEGHEYDVVNVCRAVVDQQNKTDYDIRGG